MLSFGSQLFRFRWYNLQSFEHKIRVALLDLKPKSKSRVNAITKSKTMLNSPWYKAHESDT